MEPGKLPGTGAGNAKLHGALENKCGSLTPSPEISSLGICPGEVTIHVHIKYYMMFIRALFIMTPDLKSKCSSSV